jgi:hypothetical protein
MAVPRPRPACHADARLARGAPPQRAPRRGLHGLDAAPPDATRRQSVALAPDARRFHLMLGAASRRPAHAGRSYDLVPRAPTTHFFSSLDWTGAYAV